MMILHGKEHNDYKWVGIEELVNLGNNDGAYIENGYKKAVELALQ